MLQGFRDWAFGKPKWRESLRGCHFEEMPSTMEVSSPVEIVSLVNTKGFAIQRRFIDGDLASQLVATADARRSEHIAHQDYGTIHPTAFGEGYLRLFTPSLMETFELALGKDWLVSFDESPIFRSDSQATPTYWHQDACVNQYPTMLVWIALTACGKDAPGLKLVVGTSNGPIEMFLTEHGPEEPKGQFIANQGWFPVAPEFMPGDAVFFNRYTIHGTQIVGSRPRYSVKITGVPAAYASNVSRPVHPSRLKEILSF